MTRFPSAHLQFMKTYASYADDPLAPVICRWAKAELDQSGPAAQAEQRRNLPSVEVDLVPAEQSGPGLIAEVAPQMNLETIGINKRSIDPLTQGEWSLGIRGQSPTESAPVADAQQEIF